MKNFRTTPEQLPNDLRTTPEQPQNDPRTTPERTPKGPANDPVGQVSHANYYEGTLQRSGQKKVCWRKNKKAHHHEPESDGV